MVKMNEIDQIMKEWELNWMWKMPPAIKIDLIERINKVAISKSEVKKNFNKAVNMICEEVGIMADKEEINIKSRDKIQKIVEDSRKELLGDSE